MFEPRIVCFFCKWCTYAGADLAGTSRKQYPPNGVVVRVNCSGRIDPQHILWAFREGADAVLVGGCHPGDCHYQDGNYKTMRRIVLLKRMLEDFGIEPERLRLEWISAAEGEKLVRVMNEFVEDVKGLGPLELDLPTRRGAQEAPVAKRAPGSSAKPGVRKPSPARTRKTSPSKKETTKKSGTTKRTTKKRTTKKATPKKVGTRKSAPKKKAARKPAKKVVKRTAPKRAARKTATAKTRSRKAKR